MAKSLFKDLFPFKTSGIALDQRFRALIRDLNSYLGQYFTPNSNGSGGFRIESADGLQSIGNVSGNDLGFMNKGGSIVMGSTLGTFISVNTEVNNGDRFIMGGSPAYLIYSTANNRLMFLENTNTPAPGQLINWSPPRPLFPEAGSNANGNWVRFADGTQICWHVTPGSGGTETWAFPQPFVGSPVVYGSIEVSSSSIFLLQFQAPSTISVVLEKYYWTGTNWAAVSSAVARVSAIGRWY